MVCFMKIVKDHSFQGNDLNDQIAFNDQIASGVRVLLTIQF